MPMLAVGVRNCLRPPPKTDSTAPVTMRSPVFKMESSELPRTRSIAAAPFSQSRRDGTSGHRVLRRFVLAGPGVVELPAVLRLEPQAERFLHLGRRSGNALCREAPQETGGDDGALADRRNRRCRDLLPVQADRLAIQVGGQAELAISGNRGRKR